MSKKLKQIFHLIVLAGALLYSSNSFEKPESKAKINEKKIIANFIKAYAAQSKPRMTISVNKELSEEVSEYKVASKTQANFTGNVNVAPKGKNAKTTEPETAPAPKGLLDQDLAQGSTAATIQPSESPKEIKPEEAAQPAEAKKVEKPIPAVEGKKPAAKPASEAKEKSAAAETKAPLAGEKEAKAPDAKPEEAKEPAAEKSEAKDSKPLTEAVQQAAKPGSEAKEKSAASETKAPEAKPEEEKAKEPAVEKSEAKDNKPLAEAVSKEEKKPEQIKAAETAAKEEKKVEPDKSEASAPAQPMPEQNKNEAAKSEPAKEAEQAKPEEPKPEQGAKLEEGKTEEPKTEPGKETSQPKPLETNPEPAAKPEPSKTEAQKPEAAKEPGPANPDQPKTEQTGSPKVAPGAETGSGDSVTLGMKFEEVEIRSELPENERENIFSESVLWRFQSAFVGPFLEVKAKIVDRATIIRQTGLEATQGKSPQEIDRMAIEMNALNKYADIYVEILVARDSESSTGYIFKADARNLKSGEVVGHVIYDGAVTKQKGKTFDVQQTARNLALLLMQDMTKTWSPEPEPKK